MNRTITKISVLAFLGFMTYGYAQQQGPYDGKVGINTEEPSATMDVRPSAINASTEATTNEGIIAPKLSKTRIANIATPVEGTLVYATDETASPISAYTGGNTKVAKITEKGYYFYNGTEWVKTGNEASQQIWQKQTNKDILLVDGDIQNTVKYTQNGGLVNTPNDIRPISSGNGTSLTSFTDINTNRIANSGNLSIQYADRVPEIHITSGEKQMKASLFVIDEKSNDSTFTRFLSNYNKVQTNQFFTREVASLYSVLNTAEHYGTGKVKLAMGAYNHAATHNGPADRIIGSYNQANSTVSSDIERLEGTYSVVTPRNTGKIALAAAARNHAYITKDTKNNITQVASTQNIGEVTRDFTGTIENLMGTYTNFEINPSVTTGIKNMYGLRIDNVNRGTEINRAIHTEAGEIRFGDLKHSVTTNVAGRGDRPVFVTADGVLKIGNASTALARAVWETDGNHVKLAVKADGTDRTDNIITINDTGQMFASSFKATSAATIFPDYVFQKYYTGTSSIKADYNFKSLSQVEDFVKANGHLPGYKSAETIKAQGYVDLMETQLTNVEKIEELYLHLMEKEKEIQDLKQRLERLEQLLK